ncbi:ABC transporter substrate-binding protein [Cohnella endophytica]|uniref:ABC transporter substrate-binding protein n=1 Tax=Cohnella endophytica TaxID=2419778 RepID=A0A494XXT2_9BACL|nr:ABC transporter substrate-binding protein [Cohnella endophytica]RKP52919.1 ABC transporter substrate-binding protein [Cohnella endophytica]
MQKWKRGSWLVAMCATLLLASACGNNGNSTNNASQSAGNAESSAPSSASASTQTESEAPEGKVTITYWNGFSGSDRPVLEALIKKFNSSQDQVEVKMEIMSWDVLYQKLTTSSASGQGPDFIAFGPENIAKYYDLGVIAPVDDFYSNSMIDTTLLPKGYDQLLHYKDHFVGFPMNYFAHALYYNKDMVKNAGLDPEKPPTTWDEMADWAVKMTDSKKGQYGMTLPSGWVYIPQLMWANGGDVIDYQTKTSMINKPEAVAAVKYWTDLVLNKKVAPAPNSDNLKMFASGKLGMMFDGPWMSPQFKAAKVNYGVALMPAGPARQVTFGAGLSMHLTSKGAKDEKIKNAVYKFAQWWFEKDTQKEWAIKIGFPPIRTDLASDPEIIEENPDLKIFMESANIGQPWLVGIVNSGKILSEVFQKYFDQILMKKADIQSTLDQASADLDKILATER